MADSTIREFLVGLGFSVDAAGQRQFVSALEGATLRAKLLGDAIEDMARTVVDKVAQVATQFEALFYQSQRLGASASSIRAFEYAISQLGGTVEGASSSLEGFGEFLRNTPHAREAIAKNLNIPLKDTADSAKFLLEVYKKLGQMPVATANLYRDAYHLGDQQTVFAGERPDAQKFYSEQLGRDQASGIGPDAMKQATEFEKSWRGVWARIGTMAEGGESKLFSALTNPMQKFSDWLDTNSKPINDAISRMAASVGALTTAWVDDLNKVNWGNVATDFDNVAKSLSYFVDEISGLVKGLEELKPYFEWLVPRLKPGSVQGSPNVYTPIPGLHIGAGNQSSLGKWWGDNAPSWLGGNSGGVTQNGQPISESNPLAVNVVKIPDNAAGGGGGAGILGSIGSAISGAYDSAKHALGLSGGAPPGIRARGAGGAPTGNEAALAKQAYDYWRGEGLSHDQALAVVGNQRGENALGGLVRGDGGSAGGQFQWHADRRADILRNTGIDVLTAGFLDQQKAARWEMEHGAGGGHVWNALKSAKTREAAVWTMVNGFERSADQRGDFATRLGFADRYGKIIQNGIATGKLPALATKPAASLPKHSATWDTGNVWNGFNANLPHGSPISGASRHVHSTVNNTVHVGTNDPKVAAAMVGVHLDRTSTDIARNLQSAQQ